MNLKKSPRKFDGFERMKDFSNASFPPNLIKVMTLAMRSALSTLPHPVSSGMFNRTQSHQRVHALWMGVWFASGSRGVHVG